MKGRGDNDPQDLLFVISIAVKTELNCKLKKNIGPANWRPVTNIPQKDVYCPCCGLISRDVNFRFTLLPLIERDSETLETGNLVMCLKIMWLAGWNLPLKPWKQVIEGSRNRIWKKTIINFSIVQKKEEKYSRGIYTILLDFHSFDDGPLMAINIITAAFAIGNSPNSSLFADNYVWDYCLISGATAPCLSTFLPNQILIR